MVLLLRHSGEIIRGRTSPTREWDDSVTSARDFRFAGLDPNRLALPDLTAAGLPLLAASPASQFTFGCSRAEKGVHRQTASIFDRSGPSASSAAARFDQRLGRASAARGAQANPIPWLSPDASLKCIAKFIFCLIVMPIRGCLRFITGWCLKSNQIPPNHPAN